MISWNDWHGFSLDPVPSTVLQHFYDTGRLRDYPNITAMIGTQQNPESHPEGDVWNHTKQVIDWCAKIARNFHYNYDECSLLVISGLLHDVGKADIWPDGKPVTFLEDGIPQAPKHALRGSQLVPAILNRMNAPEWMTPQVVRLVGDHMYHMKYVKGESIPKKELQDFYKSYESIGLPVDILMGLITADNNGRTGKYGERNYRRGLPEGAYHLWEDLQRVTPWVNI